MSSTTSTTTSRNTTNYFLKARTRDGFSLKLLSEYVSNQLKFPLFKTTPEGIFLRSTDQNREILVDIQMPRENFTVFKCTNPLHFVVNSNHFYRLLKTIKKKDCVTIFIAEHRSMQLGFCVQQNEEKGDQVTTYINITYVRPDEIELPDGYEKQIIVTAKHFQKLKALNIGTEMNITMLNSSMKLFVNGKNLFSREIPLGEDSDCEEDESKAITQTYTTSHITQLTKCAGQQGNVVMCYHEELPLLTKMKIGSLASLNVYIKSHELMAALDERDVKDVSKDEDADEESPENEDEKEDDEDDEEGNNSDKEVEKDDSE